MLDAVAVWPRERMNAVPAPFYLFAVGHGEGHGLLLDGGVTVTPLELDGWLTALEANLTTAAKAEPRVLVLGACYTGVFIPELSAPGRVVITSGKFR